MLTGRIKTRTLILAGILLASIHHRAQANSPYEFTRMDEVKSKAIVSNTAKAEVILVGKVKAVGTPPRAWSGVYAAYQDVTYQPVRYLKGQPADSNQDTIVVSHPVVARSMTADPHTPRLKESVFKPGAELILFLQRKAPRLETSDENYGAVPYNPEALQLVLNSLQREAH